jgi:hypothetical protein
MTSHPKYIHYNYPTPATPAYPVQTASYPVKPTYHLARATTPSLYTSAVLATGVIGAVAGSSAAMAINLHRVQDKQMTMSQAAIDSLAKGAGAGVATAAGIAVARAVGGGSLATLLVMVGAATGVGYMLSAVGKSAAAKATSSKAEKSK